MSFRSNIMQIINYVHNEVFIIDDKNLDTVYYSVNLLKIN